MDQRYSVDTSRRRNDIPSEIGENLNDDDVEGLFQPPSLTDEEMSEEDKEGKDEVKNKKNQKKIKPGSARFDCLFIKRFCTIVCCYMGCCSVSHCCLMFLMVPLAVGLAVLKIMESYLVGYVYTFFSEQNWTSVWMLIVILLFLYTVETIFEVFITSGGLAILFAYFWRKSITTNILKLYFSKKNYYLLLHKYDAVDNPDQRIHSDVYDFTFYMSVVMVNSFNSCVQLIMDVYVLIKMDGYWLLIPIFIFPIFNTIIYAILFTPLATWIFKKDSKEGDFRFLHARVREYAESMSFFSSEEKERSKIEKTFNRLVRTLSCLACVTYFIDFYNIFSGNFPDAMFIVTLAILRLANGAPYQNVTKDNLSGSVIAGITMQVYTLSTSTNAAITGIFGLATNIGVVIGNTARIGQLIETLDLIDAEEIEMIKRSEKINKELTNERNEEEDEVTNNLCHEEGLEGPIGTDMNGIFLPSRDSIKLENVTVTTPKGKVLIRGVSTEITEGNSLIIMGPSGSGKSSLLRVLCGLWPFEEGTISKPLTIGRKSLFFIAQKPYLINGSLKENIIYPSSPSQASHVSDIKLMEVMKKAEIDYLLSRASLHAPNVNWDEKLSIGEKQRVALARVFYHRPKFVILDESTSALDPENEEKVYENMKKEGITMISVAHRNSVVKYHERMLYVNNDSKGGYILRDVQKEDIIEYDYPWKVLSSFRVSAEERDSTEISLKYSDIEMSDENIGGSGINLKLIRRVFRLCFCGIMIRPNFFCWLFVIFIIIFGMVSPIVSLPLVLASGGVMGAVTSKNVVMMLVYCIVYVVTFIAVSCCNSVNDLFYVYQGIMFRYNVVTHLHERYFREKMFYKINFLDKEIENVDQRITQDADKMTTGFTFGDSGFSLVERLFITSLFGVLTNLISAAILGSWEIPLFALVIFAIAIVLQLVLSYFLSKYRYLFQKREGYFRSSLTRMKEYSEQIAFYEGKELEYEIIHERFLRLMYNQIIYGFLQVINNSSIVFIMKLANVLGYIALAFGANMKWIDISEMSKDEIVTLVQTNFQFFQGATTSFLGLLAIVVMVGSLGGFIGRISQTIEKLDELERKYESEEEEELEDRRREVEDRVAVKSMTLWTPTEKKLFYNLSFCVKKSENLLIRGPSGCGKSSVLRAISGMWRTYGKDCEIKCPIRVGHGGIFFLPQRPYIVVGSMKENIMYPEEMEEDGEEEIMMERKERLVKILKDVNLGYILERFPDLDEEKDWGTILSPGEQQRVGMARLVYHKPRFAILDESTSALDSENEDLMHEICIREDITYLSVGHRRSLFKYHNRLLRFDGNGGWVFSIKDEETIGTVDNEIESSEEEEDMIDVTTENTEKYEMESDD